MPFISKYSHNYDLLIKQRRKAKEDKELENFANFLLAHLDDNNYSPQTSIKTLPKIIRLYRQNIYNKNPTVLVSFEENLQSLLTAIDLALDPDPSNTSNDDIRSETHVYNYIKIYNKLTKAIMKKKRIENKISLELMLNQLKNIDKKVDKKRIKQYYIDQFVPRMLLRRSSESNANEHPFLQLGFERFNPINTYQLFPSVEAARLYEFEKKEVDVLDAEQHTTENENAYYRNYNLFRPVMQESNQLFFGSDGDDEGGVILEEEFPEGWKNWDQMTPHTMRLINFEAISAGDSVNRASYLAKIIHENESADTRLYLSDEELIKIKNEIGEEIKNEEGEEIKNEEGEEIKNEEGEEIEDEGEEIEDEEGEEIEDEEGEEIEDEEGEEIETPEDIETTQLLEKYFGKNIRKYNNDNADNIYNIFLSSPTYGELLFYDANRQEPEYPLRFILNANLHRDDAYEFFKQQNRYLSEKEFNVFYNKDVRKFSKFASRRKFENSGESLYDIYTNDVYFDLSYPKRILTMKRNEPATYNHYARIINKLKFKEKREYYNEPDNDIRLHTSLGFDGYENEIGYDTWYAGNSFNGYLDNFVPIHRNTAKKANIFDSYNIFGRKAFGNETYFNAFSFGNGYLDAPQLLNNKFILLVKNQIKAVRVHPYYEYIEFLTKDNQIIKQYFPPARKKLKKKLLAFKTKTRKKLKPNKKYKVTKLEWDTNKHKFYSNKNFITQGISFVDASQPIQNRELIISLNKKTPMVLNYELAKIIESPITAYDIIRHLKLKKMPSQYKLLFRKDYAQAMSKINKTAIIRSIYVPHILANSKKSALYKYFYPHLSKNDKAAKNRIDVAREAEIAEAEQSQLFDAMVKDYNVAPEIAHEVLMEDEVQRLITLEERLKENLPIKNSREIITLKFNKESGEPVIEERFLGSGPHIANIKEKLNDIRDNKFNRVEKNWFNEIALEPIKFNAYKFFDPESYIDNSDSDVERLELPREEYSRTNRFLKAFKHRASITNLKKYGLAKPYFFKLGRVIRRRNLIPKKIKQKTNTPKIFKPLINNIKNFKTFLTILPSRIPRFLLRKKLRKRAHKIFSTPKKRLNSIKAANRANSNKINKMLIGLKSNKIKKYYKKKEKFMNLRKIKYEPYLEFIKQHDEIDLDEPGRKINNPRSYHKIKQRRASIKLRLSNYFKECAYDEEQLQFFNIKNILKIIYEKMFKHLRFYRFTYPFTKKYNLVNPFSDMYYVFSIKDFINRSKKIKLKKRKHIYVSAKKVNKQYPLQLSFNKAAYLNKPKIETNFEYDSALQIFEKLLRTHSYLLPKNFKFPKKEMLTFKDIEENYAHLVNAIQPPIIYKIAYEIENFINTLNNLKTRDDIFTKNTIKKFKTFFKGKTNDFNSAFMKKQNHSFNYNFLQNKILPKIYFKFHDQTQNYFGKKYFQTKTLKHINYNNYKVQTMKYAGERLNYFDKYNDFHQMENLDKLIWKNIAFDIGAESEISWFGPRLKPKSFEDILDPLKTLDLSSTTKKAIIKKLKNLNIYLPKVETYFENKGIRPTSYSTRVDPILTIPAMFSALKSRLVPIESTIKAKKKQKFIELKFREEERALHRNVLHNIINQIFVSKKVPSYNLNIFQRLYLCYLKYKNALHHEMKLTSSVVNHELESFPYIKFTYTIDPQSISYKATHKEDTFNNPSILYNFHIYNEPINFAELNFLQKKIRNIQINKFNLNTTEYHNPYLNIEELLFDDKDLKALNSYFTAYSNKYLNQEFYKDNIIRDLFFKSDFAKSLSILDNQRIFSWPVNPLNILIHPDNLSNTHDQDFLKYIRFYKKPHDKSFGRAAQKAVKKVKKHYKTQLKNRPFWTRATHNMRFTLKARIIRAQRPSSGKIIQSLTRKQRNLQRLIAADKMQSHATSAILAEPSFANALFFTYPLIYNKQKNIGFKNASTINDISVRSMFSKTIPIKDNFMFNENFKIFSNIDLDFLIDDIFKNTKDIHVLESEDKNFNDNLFT